MRRRVPPLVQTGPMRVRLGVLVCLAVVTLAVGWAVGPRFHHGFPSMVDDWSAIENSPAQLREALRLRNPEGLRYRPGFIAWNALQWHTLGAPGDRVGPRLWELLRVAVLIVGVTLLALLVAESRRPRVGGRDARWLLVAGVPLAVLTVQPLTVDLSRYGPQEPLLVGCMALGAVLFVHALDALLEPAPAVARTAAAAALGFVLWSFGVLQKETSTCVLLLAPFLVPTILDQRARWRRIGRGQRLAIGVVAAGIVLPFVPMVVRTIQLGLADQRFYEEAAAAQSFTARLVDQLRIGDSLHGQLPGLIVFGAVVVVVATALRVGVDWLSTGLLVVALAFVLFAADAGVVATRYYLPPLVLAALALARAAVPLGPAVVSVVGAVLVAGGLVQAHDARGWVEQWVAGERAQETVVREAAGRAAAGCGIRVTGLNAEYVLALPVLMPLADAASRDCRPGERFVVVLDYGAPGDATPPTDPVLEACAPEERPVWSSYLGKILRCTT
jgi:hypothetical protein